MCFHTVPGVCRGGLPTGYGMNTGVTNPLYGSFPIIKLSSFTGILGGGGRTSRRGPTGQVDLGETLSYLHGKHAFKYGFEYLDNIFEGDTYSGAQGAASFTTPAKFPPGHPEQLRRFFWAMVHRTPGLTGTEFLLRMIGASTPESP